MFVDSFDFFLFICCVVLVGFGLMLFFGCMMVVVFQFEFGNLDDYIKMVLLLINKLCVFKKLLFLVEDKVVVVVVIDQVNCMVKVGEMNYELKFEDDFILCMYCMGVCLQVVENIVIGQDMVECVFQVWVYLLKYLKNMFGFYKGFGVVVL